jgi:hypothetical protein
MKHPNGFAGGCATNGVLICPLTGEPHKLLWMRSAWWCEDCLQKLETCCDGDCASIAAVGAAARAAADERTPERGAASLRAALR